MNKFVITSEEELRSYIKQALEQPLKEINNSLKQLVKPVKKNLTVKEVAVQLNVSELTVRNYINKGFIKADKIGRRVVINAENLEKSLSEVKSLKYRR
ncbi:helix-turn-helix domain-containing protein [Lacinutrix algicola]|uniref:helix-turn-helix domain-containing protein n=1 Tax=Lacinutrix algicola TaxID=342954 RepID=UPI0006E3F9D8|nr:helix-turn-helix domain-containing protein [Lacinutrix algicola]